jgi:molybdopterin-biosynthesis enzyme MoeA-like protein
MARKKVDATENLIAYFMEQPLEIAETALKSITAVMNSRRKSETTNQAPAPAAKPAAARKVKKMTAAEQVPELQAETAPLELVAHAEI